MTVNIFGKLLIYFHFPGVLFWNTLKKRALGSTMVHRTEQTLSQSLRVGFLLLLKLAYFCQYFLRNTDRVIFSRVVDLTANWFRRKGFSGFRFCQTIQLTSESWSVNNKIENNFDFGGR